MTISTIITRDGVTAYHLDTTFGTAPGSGYTRIYPSGECIVQLDAPGLERMDQRHDVFGSQGYVPGLKGGSCSLPLYLRPRSQTLTKDVGGPTASSVWALLKIIFGGGGTVAAGSLVASAASASQFTVTGGQGGRFAAGGVVIVADSAIGIEYWPCMVTNVSTDTLTVWPALPSVPTNGAVVYNSESVYAAQTLTQSFTLGHAPAAATANQCTLVSCIADPQIKIENGAIAGMTLGIQAATWIDPSGTIPDIDQGTPVADDMGVPLVGGRGVSFLSTADGTIAYSDDPHEVRKLGVSLSLGNAFLQQLGGTEGKAGVARIPGQRSAAKVTIEQRFDPDNFAAFSPGVQSTFQFAHFTTIGSGKMVGFFCKALQLTKTVEVFSDGGLLCMRAELATTSTDSMLGETGGEQSQFVLFGG